MFIKGRNKDVNLGCISWKSCQTGKAFYICFSLLSIWFNLRQRLLPMKQMLLITSKNKIAIVKIDAPLLKKSPSLIKPIFFLNQGEKTLLWVISNISKRFIRNWFVTVMHFLISAIFIKCRCYVMKNTATSTENWKQGLDTPLFLFRQSLVNMWMLPEIWRFLLQVECVPSSFIHRKPNLQYPRM